jgi:hypothetical protein
LAYSKIVLICYRNFGVSVSEIFPSFRSFEILEAIAGLFSGFSTYLFGHKSMGLGEINAARYIIVLICPGRRILATSFPSQSTVAAACHSSREQT